MTKNEIDIMFSEEFQKEQDEIRLSIENKYPGYELVSESTYRRIYKNSGEEIIVDALGKYYHINKMGVDMLAYDVVATLKNEDAELFFRLEWLDDFRHHPSEQLRRMFLSDVIALQLLTIIYFAILLFFPASGNWFFKILSSFALAYCTTIAFPYFHSLFCICSGIVKTYVWTMKQIIKNRSKNKKYFHYFYNDLTKSCDEGKAMAARIMKILI